MSDKYWKIVEELLQRDDFTSYDYDKFYNNNRIEQSKYSCIISLHDSIYKRLRIETAYWFRQCVETMLNSQDRNQWIQISRKVYDLIKVYAEYCGLQVQDSLFYGLVRIEKTVSQSCNEYTKEMKVLEETFKRIYQYYDIAKKGEVTGDAHLRKYSGFDHFISYAQKLAIYEAVNQLPGTSLVVSLPTGSGKSLCYILPTLMEPYKLTIVIEPTISLIMDQKSIVDKFFLGYDLQPNAYYADVEEGRNEVLKKLVEGRTSILYISPEALLQPPFMNCLIELAKKDKIGRLVIDEVHLVEEWGRKFRTEFQLIGVLKKKLNKFMSLNNKLKTLLLSATITDNVTRIIENVLSEGNEPIYYVKGERIRNEIIYHVINAKEISKQRTILYNILPYIPKPCIIYVDEKSDAKEIYGNLHDIGYRNIGMFTGDTTKLERLVLLNKWEINEIDIMVANSAFGMGVDKANIRSIIHCYVPENFNRFYQEVGRAGRDGSNALSLWIYTNDDITAASSKHNSDILTQESIDARWTAMLQQRVEAYYDNSVVVSMDSVRDTLQGNITGEHNRDWNESMILLLARYGAVKILDVENVLGTYQFTIIINNEILNKEKVQQFLERIHASERDQINEEFHKVRNFLQETSKECLSSIIGRVYMYKDSNILCGGCPFCQKVLIYSNRKKESIELKITNEYLKRRGKSGYLIYKGDIVEKVKEMVKRGIHYFMFEDKELVRHLLNDDELAEKKLMLFLIDINNKSAEWVNMIYGQCAAFYKINKKGIFKYLTQNNMDEKGDELFGLMHVVNEDFECETNRNLSQNLFHIY